MLALNRHRGLKVKIVMNKQGYDIGVKGQQWTLAEQEKWQERQLIKRSYQVEVLERINALKADDENYSVEQYNTLSYGDKQYPLYVIKNKQWQQHKKTVLITGGVHGYETSGVQGAIRFAELLTSDKFTKQYCQQFNFIIAPCISPWGFETINRWNPLAIDPNRSFYQDSPAQESAALMAYINDAHADIFIHVDLHETTDSDNLEFRPALAARDAVEHKNWNIPDGFYLVGDTTKAQAEFQKTIITSVEKVTHIAPADESGKLIGVALEQFGVINYAARELGLCMGLTNAPYVTTTEVYPDSPKVDDENCIVAQVAAITGALDYVIKLA